MSQLSPAMNQLILSELNVYLFCFVLFVLLWLVPRAQIKFILTVLLASTDLRQDGPWVSFLTQWFSLIICG